MNVPTAIRRVLWRACDKDAIATLAILAGTQVVGVFEVDGVNRALRDERIDDERRRGGLLERLQLFRLEAHVLVLGDLVALHRLFAGDDAVDRALEAHLDPAAALRVEQVEGDTLRAGGREELDRDDGQPEGDVEVLQRARHRWYTQRNLALGVRGL